MSFTRCRLCLYPTTKPDLHFDETGQCSACRAYSKRPEIDWKAREEELIKILDSHKNTSGFDCIVPSSGGKDSHWQALKIIELGYKPLIVTATTCKLTDVGRRNIDNLARYATTIEVSPNKTVRKNLNRFGLETVGDISWPEHMAIFTTPFRIAADLKIPLIFYGECPQEAYGGPPETDQAKTLTTRWRSEFGGFLGLRPSDAIGQMGITERDMTDYVLPENLEGITAYFLGQFYEWDSHRNIEVAKSHGMTTDYLPCEANWWMGENLDNAHTGLHDHLCFLKYGYGRAAAQLSVDIRKGLISREEALKICEQRDGLFPYDYMGIDVEEILDDLEMSQEELEVILDRFTNKEINKKVA